AFYGSLAVAQNFKMPKSGTCSPINGFDLVAGTVPPSEAPGRPQLVSGTACLNSAGDILYVDYLVHYAALSADKDHQGFPLHVSMALPFPSLSGGSASVALDNFSGATNLDPSTTAHANACIPQRPEIP